MTQNEIIEMYLEVSNKLCNGTEWCWAGVGEPLQMFAKLVAAKALAQPKPVAELIYRSQGSAGPPARFNAQQEQEPVADDFFRMIADRNPKPFSTPQRTWVGLTDEEFDYLRDNNFGLSHLISAVEAKLKEKNNLDIK
jgi:hypothetical protein